MGIFSFLSKNKKEVLNDGLEKTKQSVWSKLSRAIMGKSVVDDDVLDNIEEALITSDVGVETTLKIIERLQTRIAKDKYLNTNELSNVLNEEICTMLAENETTANLSFEDPLPAKPLSQKKQVKRFASVPLILSALPPSNSCVFGAKE